MVQDQPATACPQLLLTFSALQSLLLTAQDIEGFLTEVAKLAAGVAHPAASCGITIRRHGQPLTVASSDARAEQVDQAQYGAGAGPCLDSLETGAIIDVPDLTADTRWTDFRHQALAHGIRSSVSIPLSIDGSTVGALNLYGPQPHAFDQATRQHAEAFATQAATALTQHLGYEKHDPAGAGSGNIRNGSRSKTVLTEARDAWDALKRDAEGREASGARCGRGRRPLRALGPAFKTYRKFSPGEPGRHEPGRCPAQMRDPRSKSTSRWCRTQIEARFREQWRGRRSRQTGRTGPESGPAPSQGPWLTPTGHSKPIAQNVLITPRQPRCARPA